MTAGLAVDLDAKIAQSTALMVLRRLALTVASGMATILVARWLQPSGYGLLQAAVATWTLVLGASDFGFTLALSREFGAQPQRRGQYLRTAYQMQVVWCSALAVVMLGLSLQAGIATQKGLCLLVLAPSVVSGAFAAGRTYYTAIFDLKITVRIDLLTNFIQITAMLGLAAGGAGPVGIAAAISGGTAAAAVWIGLAALRVTDPNPPDRFARRHLLRIAGPLGVTAIMSKLYVSIDVAILGYFAVGKELGNYAAASKMLILLNMIPGLFFASALPGLAVVFGEREQFQRLVARLNYWVVACLAPLFAFAAVYAPLIVHVVLGSAFSGSAELLRVLCVAGAVGLFGQLLGSMLIAAGIIRMMFWQNLVAAILNIGLNIALIPQFGAFACAWITVGTEVFVAGASFIVVSRRRLTSMDVRRTALAVLPVATALLLPSVFFTGWFAMVVSSVLVVLAYLAFGIWPDELVPARWRGGRFTYAGVAPLVAAAKAQVITYADTEHVVD